MVFFKYSNYYRFGNQYGWVLVRLNSKSYDYVPLPLPFLGLRYRYRSVTVFGPTLPNVTQRDINVTNRHGPLPNFTVTCVTSVTSVTDHNIMYFEHIFKVLFKKLM